MYRIVSSPHPFTSASHARTSNKHSQSVYLHHHLNFLPFFLNIIQVLMETVTDDNQSWWNLFLPCISKWEKNIELKMKIIVAILSKLIRFSRAILPIFWISGEGNKKKRIHENPQWRTSKHCIKETPCCSIPLNLKFMYDKINGMLRYVTAIQRDIRVDWDI